MNAALPVHIVRPASVLAAVLFVLAGVPAPAQVMKNHDSNAPVNFNADRIEVQDRADRVVISGNVEVTQAGMKMNAARMTVLYTKAPQPATVPSAAPAMPTPAAGTDNAMNNVTVNRIDASGNVVVVKGNETARGNVGIYDLNRRLITMLGNVELVQGTNRLTGGRLVIDLASGRSTVDGRSAATNSASASGRVSGTFSVPQRPQP
jgi:lipopolysaccharide export system protein LptA